MFRPVGTSQAWVVIAYVLLLLFRLHLTSRDEIVPSWADSADYAAGIDHDMWFQDQRTGVSAVAWVVRELGIPYKLALDAVYVGLCFVAARRLARWAESEMLGLVIFFVLAFASYFLRSSLTFLSDPPTACAILAGTLLYSRLLSAPVSQWRWRDGVTGGIILALWALIRPEEPMILATVFLLAAATVLLHRSYWKEGWNRKAFIFLMPLVLMAASEEAVRLHNFHKHHLAVQSHSYGPGGMALLNALYSIPPDREIRYCPVPRTTFEAAARVSPTLRALLPQLTDTQNVFYLYASDYYHVPGEVSGWLNFLLPQVYGQAYSLEDGSADQFMMRTAAEIRAAQDRGELGRRWARFPIDPLWRTWLPDLPKALLVGTWNSLGLHFEKRELGQEDKLRADVLPLADEKNYTEGLLLRTALNESGELDVSGVLATAGAPSRMTNVLLRTQDGVIAASPVYPFTDFSHPARFNLVARPAHDVAEVSLEFWSRDQLRQSLALAVPSAVPTGVDVGGEPWKIEARQTVFLPSPAQRMKAALLSVNDLILVAGLIVCAALAACRALTRPKVSLFPLLILVMTAVSFVLPRIIFYSLLFVWLDWSSLRYFASSAPAALLALLTGSILAGTWAGAAFRKPTASAGQPGSTGAPRSGTSGF